MWNSEKMLAYAKRQIVELELQKAIDNYGIDRGFLLLRWLLLNRIELLSKGEFWEGNSNDLMSTIRGVIREMKIPIVVMFDYGDRVTFACAIIVLVQHGNVFVLDEIISRNFDIIKKKIEEYDPQYFSLDSIARRRKIEMTLR